MSDNGTEVLGLPEPEAPQTQLDPEPLGPVDMLPPEPPARGFPWAALILILVALAGLGAVGYVAWQRGLLDSVFPQSGAQPPATQVKVVSAPPPTSGDTADEDQLDKLSDNVSGLGPYRRYVDILHKLDAELDATKIDTASPGVLAELTRQRMHELQDIGSQFSRDYTDFEQRAVRDTAPMLQPYQEIVRQAFVERMRRFIATVGKAYVIEPKANFPVYTMSDTFIGTVKQAGRADPTVLTNEWLAAVHRQEQDVLSSQYAPQLAELQARIEKLKDLHRTTDQKLKAEPEYHIRGGSLGVTARELLDLYESLATQVEAQVVDFEKYVATLPPDHGGSDAIDAKIKEFNDLAQQDHFYAFSETYKIYEDDKDLDHPAYKRLKEHYEFVKTHWPKVEGNYVQVYTEAENKWAATWAPQQQ